MKGRDIKYNVALINSGSLRANYEAGKITVLDMKTVQPFENTIDYCVAPMRVSHMNSHCLIKLNHFLKISISLDIERSVAIFCFIIVTRREWRFRSIFASWR